VPLTNSYNSLAQANEQPEYQVLWEPIAVDPASAAPITVPPALFNVGWVPGCVLQYNTAGVGAYPPLGLGSTTYPGGDSGGSGNPTFPNNWTVQYVDPMVGATAANLPYIAGILLGVVSLGAPAPVVPNTVGSTVAPTWAAMVGKRGICQAYVDTTTVIGHTQNISTTSAHVGTLTDTGGTTRTIGTTVGIALQAVTVSTSAQLCWISLNIT
jgi:hypothetical protein